MNNIKKYFDKIDIIYWINLDRAEERRNNMIDILKEFPVENQRISALDGKNIKDISDLSDYFIYNNFNRTIVEYACMYSHFKSILTFYESKKDYALILEDDILLDYVKYWDKSISEIINNTPEDWDVILLGYSYIRPLDDDYTPWYDIGGAFSYIINKKGAEKFIKDAYRDNKFILNDNNPHVSDYYIFGFLKTYVYKYPYFTYPLDNDSSIHNDHVNNDSIYSHSNYKKQAFAAWKNKYNLNEKDLFTNTYFNIGKSIIYLILLLIVLIFILIIIYY
jgi:GR25 family glycosyltransferase involved in LPS biosynthesis